MSKYKNILIAIDGSEMSDAVMEAAKEVIHEDSNVYVETIVDYPGTLGAINEDAIIESDYEKAEKDLAEIIARHPDLKLLAKSFVAEVQVGNPHKMLAREIPDELGIDVIVIGKTTKTSLMDKIFIGSTAKAIVADARCDVIVVKTM